MRDLTMSEIRKSLGVLPARLGRKGTLAVTRRGKRVLAMMSWDLYESLVETLEVLSDREAMRAINADRKATRQGRDRSLDWEAAKARLES